MTQNEIIEMWNSVIKYAPSEVRIAEFAKLVAEKEREACAKIYEEFCYGSTKILVEKAIKARGQA